MAPAGTDDPLAIEPPETGRIHGHRRRVHLADGSPKGRLRLDAAARMLQDVSDEDTTDAGFPPGEPWVVRRVEMLVTEFPVFRQQVDVTTWCSGIGARWAERRVRVQVVDGPGRVEAAALWVHLDASGRPARLPQAFLDAYGAAAGGRQVTARLSHGLPPEQAERRPWPLRASDFDVFGHVNNAATWEAIVDELDRLGVRPQEAELEYRDAIEPTDEVEIVRVPGDDVVSLWLVAGGAVRASAVVRPR